MKSFFNRLPPFKGKLRFARMFHMYSIKTRKNIQVSVQDGLNFIVPNFVENLSFELFINGIYDKTLVDFLVKKIPQNGIFVDVGANIGSISVFIAHRRPDVTVYSFEASPHVFAYLRQNVSLNKLKNVHIYNNAIHKADGEVMNFYSPDKKFGKGSFSSVFTEQAEQVNTIRLDSFFEKNHIIPDIIKVDVEGFEKMIFESLEGFFNNGNKPQIIFEFVAWAEDASLTFYVGEAQQHLLDKGYKLYRFEEFARTGSGTQIKTPLTRDAADLIAI